MKKGELFEIEDTHMAFRRFVYGLLTRKYTWIIFAVNLFTRYPKKDTLASKDE